MLSDQFNNHVSPQLLIIFTFHFTFYPFMDSFSLKLMLDVHMHLLLIYEVYYVQCVRGFTTVSVHLTPTISRTGVWNVYYDVS